MIIWLFSGFAAIVATIVGFFMATGLVLEQDDKESNQSTTVGFFTKVVATMLILYSIANAVLYIQCRLVTRRRAHLLLLHRSPPTTGSSRILNIRLS